MENLELRFLLEEACRSFQQGYNRDKSDSEKIEVRFESAQKQYCFDIQGERRINDGIEDVPAWYVLIFINNKEVIRQGMVISNNDMVIPYNNVDIAEKETLLSALKQLIIYGLNYCKQSQDEIVAYMSSGIYSKFSNA